MIEHRRCGCVKPDDSMLIPCKDHQAPWDAGEVYTHIRKHYQGDDGAIFVAACGQPRPSASISVEHYRLRESAKQIAGQIGRLPERLCPRCVEAVA